MRKINRRTPVALNRICVRSAGFTLVELIVVLVILGIISAIAIPRFFTRGQFDAYGFAEASRSALHFAQKSAIAKRRNTCVTIAANTLTLSFSSTFGGACDTALKNPADSSNFVLTAPNGITITNAGFSFDALGRPSAAQNLTINGGDQPITLNVQAETGYVP